MREKIYMLELILDECKQDPDPVNKILLFRIRIRPKVDRIRNPVRNKTLLTSVNGLVGVLDNWWAKNRPERSLNLDGHRIISE